MPRPWLSAAALRAALAAYARGEDCGAALSREWEAYLRDAPFEYKKGRHLGPPGAPGRPLAPEGLSKMTASAFPILRTVSRSKITAILPGGAEFVAYLDAIGEIDGMRCLIDWKTRAQE